MHRMHYDLNARYRFNVHLLIREDITVGGMENAYIQHNSSFVKLIKMMNQTVVPQTKEVENYTAGGKKHQYKHYSCT